MRIGDAFAAFIQMVKTAESKKSRKKVSASPEEASVKKEISKKQKKLVKQDSD
jgi:hypothetical protein